MNKLELIAELAKKTGLSRNKSRGVVNALFGTETTPGLIETALDSGDRVVISGFGTFKRGIRRAYEGCNPATGVRVDVPSKYCVTFKPGKNLKARIETRTPEAVESGQRNEEVDDEGRSTA